MAKNKEKFIELINFYNYMTTIMSAIAVKKGGIPMENYTGRYFLADILEFVLAYGKKLQETSPEVEPVVKKLQIQFDKVKDLTTPNSKPIYEMSLEEFEKMINL